MTQGLEHRVQKKVFASLCWLLNAQCPWAFLPLHMIAEEAGEHEIGSELCL